MTGEAAVKPCGRWFCAGDLEIVRREIRCADPPLRAEIARRVAEDFETAYGVRPVLSETFVESRRHVGTCYRAANRIALGRTTGRGKGDRDRTAARLRKPVYVYPLVADFRRRLGVVA